MLLKIAKTYYLSKMFLLCKLFMIMTLFHSSDGLFGENATFSLGQIGIGKVVPRSENC